ncbi:unnamed protein product [Leuciscus chuanchicus]
MQRWLFFCWTAMRRSISPLLQERQTHLLHCQVLDLNQIEKLIFLFLEVVFLEKEHDEEEALHARPDAVERGESRSE